MKVIHYTHCLALPSILRRGLAPGVARGAKRIWFCRGTRAEAWALNHVCESHDWPPWQLVRLVYNVPDAYLCKTGRPGILWTPYAIDVPPMCLSRLDSTRTSGRPVAWLSPRG